MTPNSPVVPAPSTSNGMQPGQTAGGGTVQTPASGGGVAVYISPAGIPIFGPGGLDAGDTSTFSGPGPNVSSGPDVGAGPEVGGGPQVGPPDYSESDAGSIR